MRLGGIGFVVALAGAAHAQQVVCGGEQQRACCLQEHPAGTPPCRAPLTESFACAGAHIDNVLAGQPPNPACLCQIGPGYSHGDCIDDTRQPGPVARTWIDPTAKTKRVLTMYVTGFDHDTLNYHQGVRRAGLQDLLQVITNDEDLVPSDLMIALAESWPTPQGDCDPGPFVNAGPYIDGGYRAGHHAECLANMLQNAGPMHGKKFHVTEWDFWPGVGGPALITGERWKPVQSYRVMVPYEAGYTCLDRNDKKCAWALGVRLRGAAPPYNDVQFVVYIVHAPGNGTADCSAPPSSLACNDTIRLLSDWMAAHAREGDLTPMLVGDFNTGIGTCLDQGTKDRYIWADKDVQWQGPSGPMPLLMETSIIHIFVGAPRSAQHPAGFAARSFLAPVAARYTRKADGSPAHATYASGGPYEGVYLPHDGHNVVAMDFAPAFDLTNLNNGSSGGCGSCHARPGAAWVGLLLPAMWLRRRRR